MSSAASGVKAGVADRWRRLLATGAPGWSILIRLLVGLVVFLPEGIQKLAFPDLLGDIVDPTPPHDDFLTVIAQVGDGATEGGQAQFEESEQNLQSRTLTHI
jgi:hypothetical protein